MVHYHLRPGGVTTVIRNARRALAGRHEVEVLADFGYDTNPRTFHRRAHEYLQRLPRTGIVHTHNIGLGKNPALTYAVRLWAESGGRIINQVHDFPEDNRPAQLRALRQHPQWRAMCYYDLPNVVWATLTAHDAAKLAARGVPAGKIHVLPNPVDDELFTQPPRPLPLKLPRPFLLQPMKVMERKNNAEAVELICRLNSLRAPSRPRPGRPRAETRPTKYALVISLNASSPRDRAYRDRLKRKIRRERLPVLIGVGEQLPDPLPLFDAAHAVLTTSRQEGFGYAFLEGWLRGKLVIGRDIPEVTRDFAAEGMDLRHLYRTLDAAAVRRLRKLLARPPRGLIEHNRAVVLRKYSLAAYAKRYERLLRKFASR
jgi:glycosyltransferase involved in cell wall biosynthesis